MQTYRFGSIALAHEGASTVPEMIWMGLRLSDVSVGGTDDEALMPLTAVERERIRAMLARQTANPDGQDGECFAELQKMLMLNVKAEIQLLEERPGGLLHWIEMSIMRETLVGDTAHELFIERQERLQ